LSAARARHAEVKIVAPKRVGDTRGFFSEVWNGHDFAAGIAADFEQDIQIRQPLNGMQPDLFEYCS
jgi:dTDP-4-dehydrorhamnose 3,5-epimerase-like enzyme